jgi:hypothetical protein
MQHLGISLMRAQAHMIFKYALANSRSQYITAPPRGVRRAAGHTYTAAVLAGRRARDWPCWRGLRPRACDTCGARARAAAGSLIGMMRHEAIIIDTSHVPQRGFLVRSGRCGTGGTLLRGFGVGGWVAATPRCCRSGALYVAR